MKRCPTCKAEDCFCPTKTECCDFCNGRHKNGHTFVIGCGNPECLCHQSPKEANYLDSMTNEERARQAELESTAVTTITSNPSPKLTTVKDVVREFDKQFGEVGYDGFAEKETTDNIKSFLRTSITSLLQTIEDEVEKMIDANDDGMWAGRETADKILTIIKEVKSSKV